MSKAKTKSNSEPDIVKAHADLVAAKTAYDKAQADEAAAAKRSADRLSELNKRQRVFDDTIKLIKGDAPAASDWFAAKGK